MAEWPEDIDAAAALAAAGVRPVPFRQFILKVHSRCDLRCDYCYIYEHADQSWREQPRRMSLHTVDQTARRIAEHVERNRQDSIELVLHGGEPLLAGAELLAYAVTRIRSAVPGTHVRATIQTNGLRLDEKHLGLFDRLGVTVGVSMDGTAAMHDRHRRRADRSGSHAAVAAAVRRLAGPAWRHLFAGLLCTIDLRNDPVETYEALLEFQPPAIDFLLPHGNWTTPPPGRDASRAVPYGHWLCAVFDRWYGAPRRETGIRLLEEVINLLLGGRSRSEQIGLSPSATVVVATDGGIEQTDVLKSVRHGAAATGLNVAASGFDEVLLAPGIVARQLGVDGLCGVCRDCGEHRVCGGGLYAHRYRRGSGFANPSVYCEDLKQLIGHVRARLRADLSAAAGARFAPSDTAA